MSNFLVSKPFAMNEDLLQFIWKFHYFNLNNLRTTNGEQVEIVSFGMQNFNQGPDFLNAKVKIGDTLWAGNIEMHVKSSMWYQHNHEQDKNYGNIILHVVWQHDKEVTDINGNTLPTLPMENRVSHLLIQEYRSLMEREQRGELNFIPCEAHLKRMELDSFKLSAWKSRLVAERLENKSEVVQHLLKQTKGSWEEVMWMMMAKGFGGNINGAFFQQIAQSIPQKILSKHKNQPITIEALLFGQAHLLEEQFDNPYPQLLQREYRFYNTKYRLPRVAGSVLFGRMRPANFPTIRLAQLAALTCTSTHLFSKIKEIEDVKRIKALLATRPNDFWLYHYKLTDKEPSEAPKEKEMGRQAAEGLVINTVCPILFACGLHHNNQIYKDRAIAWLEQLGPEKNKITNGFVNLGVTNKNAFDSQALIQLKTYYCDNKRCLECTIGNMILKKPVNA